MLSEMYVCNMVLMYMHIIYIAARTLRHRGAAASSGTHTNTLVHEYRRLARALSGAPVCGIRKLPEGGHRDTGGLRDAVTTYLCRLVSLFSVKEALIQTNYSMVSDLYVYNMVLIFLQFRFRKIACKP